MGYVLMLFSSSTTASRLKKLAFREGVREVSIVQTPKGISKNGCTYSIRCSTERMLFLKKLADEYGISHNGIFREYLDANGNKSYEKI